MQADFEYPALLLVNSASWEYEVNTRSFVSPFTNTAQVVEAQGHKWRATFNYQNLTKEQSHLLRWMEAVSKGGSKSFAIPMQGNDYLGNATLAAVVSGAGQGGTTLETSNWGPNAVALEVGSLFSVNGEMKTSTARVVANGSGVATLQFEPPLRDTPNSGERIHYNPPIPTMRRVVNESASQSLTNGSEMTGTLVATSIGFEEKIF
ncbi:hypothetical protein JCM19235_1959 [Vibrio maritimus]|uniref:Uncharacterized protein n=1 Tax=Vibrio maritimus TaxID=990268 RepID=A0A090RTE8_9VIBR|nr:hypothetical protein JCM19235_1959 [Vibrio maritimus]